MRLIIRGFLVILLCSLLSPKLLCAQAVADEKCEGSTVDTQGPKTANAARAFLAELQQAVQANDQKKIAGMISYPMNFIHEGKRTRIRNKQTLIARYDSIFTEHIRKAILQQSAHCLFGNYQGEMIGNGEVWFSEMDDGSVKIITVNSSAGK
jgi:hypothetical protein